MSLAQSRITAEGQVSIPVSVMRQFGLAPGELITWNTLEGHLILEKAGQYSLVDVQRPQAAQGACQDRCRHPGRHQDQAEG